jgi:hypothetical protein
MVDAKYVLFIIDKFAGAGYLVEEMNLVYDEDVDDKAETSGVIEKVLNAE